MLSFEVEVEITGRAMRLYHNAEALKISGRNVSLSTDITTGSSRLNLGHARNPMFLNAHSVARTVLFVSLCFALVLCRSFTAKGQDQPLPMDKVNALLDPKVLGVKANGKPKFPAGIVTGRYMEEDIQGHCLVGASFPKWENLPLIKCTYRQADKSVPTKEKIATAIMLNPDKELLARWIVASCLIVKGNGNIDNCTVKLAKIIIDASGSQFVVAGIVLEDINPTDQIQEAYTFRDGVTAKVTDGLAVGFKGAFGDNESKIALDPAKTVLATASLKGPARIQSTWRAMYSDYMGDRAKDVAGTKWLDVVRELYQDAWKRAHNDALPETVEKYRNDLMVAKCYAVMGITPPH